MSEELRRGRGEQGLARFIKSAFRSIWSLELMLLVRDRAGHEWTQAELIDGMRASEQVLAGSVADLVAAGLVRVTDARVRFAPQSPELIETAEAVALLYAARPAKVRRLIVGGDSEDQLIRFADAFRLRGDRS